MRSKLGRRKKGYVPIYSTVPPPINAFIEREAERRGLDKADIIREALIEKFRAQSEKTGDEGISKNE